MYILVPKIEDESEEIKALREKATSVSEFELLEVDARDLRGMDRSTFQPIRLPRDAFKKK